MYLLNPTLDFCVEIQKEMISMKVQLEPDDVKKFVKSATVQLYRLKKEFDENPTCQKKETAQEVACFGKDLWQMTGRICCGLNSSFYQPSLGRSNIVLAILFKSKTQGSIAALWLPTFLQVQPF